MDTPIPLPMMLQNVSPPIVNGNILPEHLPQIHPSHEILQAPEEIMQNQYILSEPMDPNAIVNPTSGWLAQLTADIKPIKERRKVKAEPVLDSFTSGSIPSITSKSVIRAAMNERVKKLDRLQQVDESTMDPALAKEHRKEKIRLLTLERSRRAAQLRRIKKKNYVRNLEGRIGMMAKHLEKLELENNQLRVLVTKWTQAEAAGEVLPEITTETISSILNPYLGNISAENVSGTSNIRVKTEADVVEMNALGAPFAEFPKMDTIMGTPVMHCNEDGNSAVGDQSQIPADCSPFDNVPQQLAGLQRTVDLLFDGN